MFWALLAFGVEVKERLEFFLCVFIKREEVSVNLLFLLQFILGCTDDSSDCCPFFV